MGINKKIMIIIGCVITCICLCMAFFFKQPEIVFKDSEVQIALHSEFHPMEYIKNINGYEEKDINVHSEKLNINQLGEYDVDYEINNHAYTLHVVVKDFTAPTFDIKDLDIDLGQPISAENLVDNIQDETQTKTYFKEDYDFSKEGESNVVVIVEDESGNKTEKQALVRITKDIEKPTLTGLNDIVVSKNGKIDYLKGVKAHDNRDPHPTIEVNSQSVKSHQTGTYEVQYTVKDRSNNQATYKRKVVIVEKKTPSYISSSQDKVIYLTFDDGPSKNTEKVLDILKKYDAKATFFVTGNGQKYNYLIKRAHDEGHTIGLHTYCHQYNKVYASVDAYFDDLTKIGNMVKEQIGFVPKYIRFPGGSSNMVSAKFSKGIMSILVNAVQEKGYQYYDWNASSGDASGNHVAVKKIIKESTSSSAKNIMLLMHDTAAKDTTVEALPQIIEYYQSKGYIFKGIDETSFTPHHGTNN